MPRRSGGRATHQHDRLGVQPPSDEQQRVRRRLVQPLRIGEQAQQGLLPGHMGEQAEHTQLGQEPVGWAGRQPEGAAERAGLRPWQSVEPLQDRAQQLVLTSERQLHLGLDPGATQDPEPSRLLGRILQQGALPDSHRAANHQHATTPPARTGQQATDQRTLFAPSIQHG
jgi:hypothetical protein